jgi:hypothetical protein
MKDGAGPRRLTDHGEEVDPPDDERAGAAHPPSVGPSPSNRIATGFSGRDLARQRPLRGRLGRRRGHRWRRRPKAATVAVARAERVGRFACELKGNGHSVSPRLVKKS